LLVGSEGVRQPLWRVPLRDADASQGTTAQASGQGPAIAAGPASGQGDEPAGDRAASTHGETLAWVLRALALALLPVALLLGRRRRR
jgi:hypothetical protein